MSNGNKTPDELDTVFGENDSLEFSSSCHEHDGAKARTFKIIVIGDSNVGKTCLTYRFCGGTFLKNPEATIGVDFRERTVVLDGESIKVSSPCFILIICYSYKSFEPWICSLLTCSQDSWQQTGFLSTFSVSLYRKHTASWVITWELPILWLKSFLYRVTNVGLFRVSALLN